eukprot:COSAG05_NODE_2670_length_2780_cov_1.848191_3_plen_162_part_00
MLSDSVKQMMVSFFSNMPAFSRKLSNDVRRFLAGDANVCLIESSVGCTDSSALNFDPTAVSDDGSCEARVWGCPGNATAASTNSAANSYNHTDPSSQCHGLYCSTDGTWTGISGPPTSNGSTSEWICPVGQQLINATEFGPVDECADDPCSSMSIDCRFPY